MSNIAQFSPYNRTYQFMHLQNSAYHARNKLAAKPRVNTNISFKECNSQQPGSLSKLLKSRRQHTQRRQKEQERKQSNQERHRFQGERQSSEQQLWQSQQQAQRQSSVGFKSPHRVIHKNESFQRAKSARILEQNVKLLSKIIKAASGVLTSDQAEKYYRSNRRYLRLRRRYQQDGEPYVTPVSSRGLNPALADYQRQSRIASARNKERSQLQFELDW